MQSNRRQAEDRAAGCVKMLAPPVTRARSRLSLPHSPGAGRLGQPADGLGVTTKRVDGRHMCDFRVQQQFGPAPSASHPLGSNTAMVFARLYGVEQGATRHPWALGGSHARPVTVGWDRMGWDGRRYSTCTGKYALFTARRVVRFFQAWSQGRIYTGVHAGAGGCGCWLKVNKYVPPCIRTGVRISASVLWAPIILEGSQPARALQVLLDTSTSYSMG